MSDRITSETIDAEIIAESYHTFPGTMMTVCALTMRCGFVVVGQSSTIYTDQFDESIGRQIARTNAAKEVAMLLAFRRREFLAERESGR